MKRILLILLSVLGYMPMNAQTRAEKIMAEIKNPNSKYVVVIAHRGDWRNWPECSLKAFDSAIKMGADAVEVDVRRTLDGHLVVCHDARIDRTTSGKGEIKEMTLDSIRKFCLRAGNNIRKRDCFIPTLEEVLDLCKGRCIINIDRGYTYYDQIIEMVKQRGMTDQILINGKKSPQSVAKRYARHEKNMPYVPILNYDNVRWPKIEQHFEDFLSGVAPHIAFEVCWNGSLEGHEKIFKRIIDSGSKLWLNTLWGSMCGGYEDNLEDDRAIENEDKIYGKILEYGASIIMTERPQLLISYLERIGRHTLD